MAVNATQRSPLKTAALPAMERRDTWWIEPVLVVVSLVTFLIYGLWRAWENTFYDTLRMAEHLGAAHFAGGIVPHYLSPFYSPPIQDWFGSRLPLSAAFFLLAFPGSFRATCYFARRSYYRAFFWDPPACAVREIVQARRGTYTGEREFPMTVQNLHRYALYAIFVFVVFHWMHLGQAFFFDVNGKSHFGIGVGTLVFGLDTVLLSLYVASCHSFRHVVGGILNRFSPSQGRWAAWSRVSALNARHGLFFWLRLLSVGLADIYVRFVCSGAIPDFHIVF